MGSDGYLSDEVMDQRPEVGVLTCYECSRPVTDAPSKQHAKCIRTTATFGRTLRVDLPDAPDGYHER